MRRHLTNTALCLLLVPLTGCGHSWMRNLHETPVGLENFRKWWEPPHCKYAPFKPSRRPLPEIYTRRPEPAGKSPEELRPPEPESEAPAPGR